MDTNNQLLMTKKQLIKALIIALIIGIVVLLTAILPAEYGMDPLGTGKLFGFSKLYQGNNTNEESVSVNTLNFRKIKLENIGSKPNIKVPEQIIDTTLKDKLPQRMDSIQVTVPPKKGLEYKIKMLRYGKTKYDWSTNKGIVYTDFHGELIYKNSKDSNGFYESYTQAYSNNIAGTFIAPFEGKHGWYFKNITKENITITIRLKGEYELIDQ